jgi:hypothetical protein
MRFSQGMPLVDVIRAATATPASALNLRDESGAYTHLSISAHTPQSDHLLMHVLKERKKGIN